LLLKVKQVSIIVQHTGHYVGAASSDRRSFTNGRRTIHLSICSNKVPVHLQGFPIKYQS